MPDERVLANRPYGVVDPPLQVIVSIAMPIISAVYLGVAEAAVRRPCDAAAPPRPTTRVVQRQVGLMAHRLRSPPGPSTAPSTRWATIPDPPSSGSPR